MLGLLKSTEEKFKLLNRDWIHWLWSAHLLLNVFVVLCLDHGLHSFLSETFPARETWVCPLGSVTLVCMHMCLYTHVHLPPCAPTHIREHTYTQTQLSLVYLFILWHYATFYSVPCTGQSWHLSLLHTGPRQAAGPEGVARLSWVAQQGSDPKKRVRKSCVDGSYMILLKLCQSRLVFLKIKISCSVRKV